MFPVFSVLFRVCSQFKPLERRGVPTVPSGFASDYLLKCDWATSKSSEQSGNTGNRRNHALNQSVAFVPSRRSFWEQWEQREGERTEVAAGFGKAQRRT